MPRMVYLCILVANFCVFLFTKNCALLFTDYNGGVIEEITNASGHYTPSVGEGMNYLRLFKKEGVDVSSTHLYLGEWDNAGNYIDIRNVHPFEASRSLYE